MNSRVGINGSASPLVTIVICAYNAGSFLRASVESALAQTYPSLEVLVVDDGSTDGSVSGLGALSLDPRLRLIAHETNRGKSAALNHALREMRGDFYAIQDADDLSFPARIERQIRPFLEDPSVGAVFCGYELILNGRRVAPNFAGRDRERCARDIHELRMPGHDATAMYRLSSVDGLEYCEDLQLNEGLDYILRVGERHSVVVVGETLYAYRSHSGSITRRLWDQHDASLQRVHSRAHARRGLLVPQPPVAPRARRGRAREMDNNLAAFFIESTLDLRRAHRRTEAFKTALTCARLRPMNPHYLKALAYSVAPGPVVRQLRREGR